MFNKSCSDRQQQSWNAAKYYAMQNNCKTAFQQSVSYDYYALLANAYKCRNIYK